MDWRQVEDLVGDERGLAGLFFAAAEAERKMPRAYDLRVRGGWPDVLPEPGLAYGYNEVEVRPSPASAAEVTRWDVAIELTKHMPVEDARLVWMAAHSAVGRERGPAWRKIGGVMGVHPATAKRRFQRAMLTLWYKVLSNC